MNPVPFIDIHTHSKRHENETITVRNLFPGDSIEAFSGRNFYSAGLHPWYLKTKEQNNELLKMLEEALEFDHVCFVGECGLDKIVETDFEEQKRVFRAQSFMAEEFKRPLVIHCVKAYSEILELHKKLHPEMPWIMHGYTGNVETTQQMAKKLIHFSFGEILFKANAKAIESFKNLPLERIFFETDEHGGDVAEIYKKGAELKNISIDTLANAVWNNFSRVENSLLGRF